ncbi:MAG TPA: amidase [Clostridiaceae bacterium]|nr:amidase [Clostridiaceae bacterium]
MLAGKLTCRQLVEYYLKRIEAYDQKGPALNSIILVNPKALEEADALDAAFKEKGLTGALHGIPIILKVNVDTYDMATTAGSLSLKGFVPEDDAYITRKLREAGAIILAKSNLHEFAIWGETISSILGQTLNPYDLTRTPGGSSGGTGASMAANFGLAGIGTDTINSIRSPSSANSLVGIRPTIGLVSRDGIVPYSFTQDTAGPICRTVADAVAVLDVIAGYDKADDETAWCCGKIPKTYKAFLNKDGLKGKRIGILESFFGKDEVHKEVNKPVRESIEILKANGAELISITEEINSGWLTSSVSVHLDDLKDHLNIYLKALPDYAPVHSVEEVMASGKYHPGIKENMEKAMALSVGTPEYNQKLVLRAQTQTKVMKLMADYELDAIVYPHQQQLVCKTGGSQQQRNGVLCSVTGFPSIAVPAGFSTPSADAPIGVPVGMEIIGRPWSEPVLIEIAYAFEQASRLRRTPESTPEL